MPVLPAHGALLILNGRLGYDRTFTLSKNSQVANIPAGYSDGYRRALSDKASVLIHGQRAPVIGKVTVLYGRQGNEETTQTELETINGALLADLYTIWGNSNPKVLKSR